MNEKLGHQDVLHSLQHGLHVRDAHRQVLIFDTFREVFSILFILQAQKGFVLLPVIFRVLRDLMNQLRIPKVQALVANLLVDEPRNLMFNVFARDSAEALDLIRFQLGI